MNPTDHLVRLRLPRAGFDLAVDLRLPARGISVLFGASGCGKTSVLRGVAGLEPAAKGLIRIDGETWQDDATRVFLPTWRRSLGYVFQEASLFEHLDVRGNLEYGLRRTQPTAGADALAHAIDLLGIEHLLPRRVDRLSGGERQRIAMARALATRPRLLLLDEPLAALDSAHRQEILPWLLRLRDESSTPMLYVTHSTDEVARLADHLVVLDRGRVQASGPVAQVLASIASPVVIGADAGALIVGQIAERDTAWHLARVDFAGGNLWLRDVGMAIGRNVRVHVLARDVSIATAEPQHSSIQNQLLGRIESVATDTHPALALLRVQCGDSILLARITQRAVAALDLHPGKSVWVQVKSVALVE